MNQEKQPDPEIDFKQALVSFLGYASFQKIPAIFFKRIQEIRAEEDIPWDEALDLMAEKLKVYQVTREQIVARLNDHQPSSPAHPHVPPPPVH